MSLPAVEYAPAPKESEATCYLHFPPHRADWISTGKATLSICDSAFKRLSEQGHARAANSQEPT